MSQWGVPFKDTISGGTFIPHLAGPAFKPMSPCGLIDDVVLIDVDSGRALQALAACRRLKVAFQGKAYAIWLEMRRKT
jgi:hypothetical protein